MPRWIERIRLKSALKADALVAAHGESLLGPDQWSLLRSFGKCMAGPPYGGQYVSGMPPGEIRKLLHSLEAGEAVPIHLMHHHQSGDYESSSLRLGPRGELVMVYADREVLAAEISKSPDTDWPVLPEPANRLTPATASVGRRRIWKSPPAQ